MHIISFFDELEKIAFESRTSIAAHEMGHAKDFESTRHPGLRKALETGISVGGLLTGLYGMASKNPALATGAMTAGVLPMLSREAIASYNAMKALKETGKYTDKELGAMRGQLMRAGGTYLSAAGGLVGGAYMTAKGKPLSFLPTVLAPLVGTITAATMVGNLENTPKSSGDQLEELRHQMGVKAKTYESDPKLPGAGGRWAELSAAYVSPTKNKIMAALAEREISRRLKKKDIKTLQEVIREGGLILPKAVV